MYMYILCTYIHVHAHYIHVYTVGVKNDFMFGCVEMVTQWCHLQ